MDVVWKEYKIRKLAFWISILLSFIGMIFWSSYFKSLILGFIAGVAIIGTAAVYFAKWKCPRCRNSFILAGAYGNVLTAKCLHCGLRSYATTEEIRKTEYALKA